MKIDVVDFARRVGMSIEEAHQWLEKNETESDVLVSIGYNKGYEDGYNEHEGSY